MGHVPCVNGAVVGFTMLWSSPGAMRNIHSYLGSRFCPHVLSCQNVLHAQSHHFIPGGISWCCTVD